MDQTPKANIPAQREQHVKSDGFQDPTCDKEAAAVDIIEIKTKETDLKQEAAFNEEDSLLEKDIKAVLPSVNKDSWHELLVKFMEISIPMILSNLSFYLFDQISLLFVGQIGDTE